MKKRIKSSINYPLALYEAIKRLKEKDKRGRTFNQIVIDILINSKEIKNEFEKNTNKDEQ